jgi:glucuronosyltransferase
MHVDEPQPLPKNLKNYLDSSKNGVIYMSLGSNVKSSDLSEGFLDIFINTFKSLEYDVLWKWEKDDLPNKPDNVRISKWLPQTDLLAHPKIKLFITQGGQVQLFFNFFSKSKFKRD